MALRNYFGAENFEIHALFLIVCLFMNFFHDLSHNEIPDFILNKLLAEL